MAPAAVVGTGSLAKTVAADGGRDGDLAGAAAAWPMNFGGKIGF